MRYSPAAQTVLAARGYQYANYSSLKTRIRMTDGFCIFSETTMNKEEEVC